MMEAFDIKHVLCDECRGAWARNEHDTGERWYFLCDECAKKLFPEEYGEE